jgi:hypothetical protein
MLVADRQGRVPRRRPQPAGRRDSRRGLRAASSHAEGDVCPLRDARCSNASWVDASWGNSPARGQGVGRIDHEGRTLFCSFARVKGRWTRTPVHKGASSNSNSRAHYLASRDMYSNVDVASYSIRIAHYVKRPQPLMHHRRLDPFPTSSRGLRSGQSDCVVRGQSRLRHPKSPPGESLPPAHHGWLHQRYPAVPYPAPRIPR